LLLVIDVGNTHTVLGVFGGAELRDHWRLVTAANRTGDEYAVLLHALFGMARLDLTSVDAAILSSVVPAAQAPIEQMLRERLRIAPLVVGPGIKTGMPILYENPREVGADRIVNAVAAYERYRAGTIVVDFGTATTFDCVTPAGEYLGGAIAPGITIGADALYRHAAKLPRVELVRPKAVVGRNTVASIQSGLLWGYVGLVDGVVRRMAAEVGFAPRVIATGGLAAVIAPQSETIQDTDDLLTLRGLKILFDRNPIER
jgi:type III pantothenate kinase